LATGDPRVGSRPGGQGPTIDDATNPERATATGEREPEALLDREVATATLALAARRARLGLGHGSAVLVEAPAGMGKTRLLHAGRELGHQLKMEVLGARGSELEREIPFGIARQLFELTVRRVTGNSRAALLDDAARLALPALERVPAQAGGQPELSATLHGLYWLAANLAAQCPMMLLIDDAHWADVPSLRFVAYLAARVGELPIVLVLATRPSEPGEQAVLLDALVAAGDASVLGLEPLSENAVRTLAERRLGAPMPATFVAAAHDASGGNPFLLDELLTSFVDRRLDARDVAAIAPVAVTRSVSARLRRLSTDARSLAQAIAVLGDDVAPRDAGELAGLPPERVRTTADELIAAHLLRTGWSLRFVHPMIRAAVDASIASSRRAHEHARAARLLSARDAEPEQVAVHLLAAERGGDPWVVEELLRAARGVLARGAAEVAASYLERALAEPPLSRELRARVTFELGVAESHIDLAASGRIAEALALTDDPRRRGVIALALGRVLGLAGQHAAAVDVFAAGLEERHEDQTLRLRTEAELVGHCLLTADRLELGFQRLQAVDVDANPREPAERLVQIVATFGRISAGAITPGRAAALARLAGADRALAQEQTASLRLFVVEILIYADDLDGADQVLDTLTREAEATGSLPAVALAAAFRSQAALRRGRVIDAEADARFALGSVGTPILGYSHAYVLSFLIDALVERAKLEEADAVLEAEGPPQPWPQVWQCGLLVGSRARLRLAQGRIEEACTDFLECGRRIAPWRPRNPGSVPWRSEAAYALAALGRTDEAKRLAAWELRHAGLGGPRATGVALRANGVLAGGSDGLAQLRESEALLARTSARLELARTLTELGAALRRSGATAEARRTLREALDLASRCGGTLLAARARQELVAAGARPRTVALRGIESLTAAELRVARAAAGGMSNRSIAQSLFIGLRTVETHLTHIYRKLDIESREQLATELGAG
jgi:DNA-binding CsgD family transcriptional regulator